MSRLGVEITKPVKERLSREGIPYRDYSLIEVLVGLVLGLPAFIYTLVVGSLTSEIEPKIAPLPKNAIIYGWHQEAYLVTFTPNFIRQVKDRLVWLAFHGFLSYVASLWTYHMGLRCFRYVRRSKVRPMDQITQFLSSEKPDIFFLRTDAGGPYGTVRPSLIRLSLEADMPLVPFRQSATRFFTIKGHVFPLPFARIVTTLGEPIEPDRLRGLEEKEALGILQDAIDRIGI